MTDSLTKAIEDGKAKLSDAQQAARLRDVLSMIEFDLKREGVPLDTRVESALLRCSLARQYIPS